MQVTFVAMAINRLSIVDMVVNIGMEGKKSYPKPKAYILNTIYDVIELQNGQLIMTDTKRGRVHYQVSMYGYVWELLYIVSDNEAERSEVSLRVIGERKDKAKEIRREFALLDAMLEGGEVVDLNLNSGM